MSRDIIPPLRLKEHRRTLWLYFRYQLLTKGFMLVVVYPLYRMLVSALLHSSGQAAVSSSDFLSFMLSFQGVGLLVASLAVLLIIVTVDVNTYILMTGLVREGRAEFTLRYMLRVALWSLRFFAKPAGVLLLIYTALVLPLIGVTLLSGPLSSLEIPNFITSVIYATPLYLALYIAALLALTFVSFRLIFTFHFLLISGVMVRQATVRSWRLTGQHSVAFIKEVLWPWAWRWLTLLLVLISSSALLFAIGLMVPHGQVLATRIVSLLWALTVAEVVALVLMLAVPTFIMALTRLFYRLQTEAGQPPVLTMAITTTTTDARPLHRKTLIAAAVVLLLANSGLAVAGAYYFDDVFRSKRHIDVIAHRGGGDLGAENTIAGIQAAASRDAKWAEIDVQRTKDGHYVLNHDKTFARVAGDKRQAKDMTLAEIKQLKITNAFDANGQPQPVPTLEEVIQATKGKIGLFIELKGSTADQQMVHDVVALIKRYDVADRAAILSLDYSLIQFSEAQYPEITTGFLYFFAFGSVEHFVGDFLIMEEAAATPNRIAAIQARGKRAIVWTVNTDESAQKFVRSQVDGIITDHVGKITAAMHERDARSDIDIIMDAVFED